MLNNHKLKKKLPQTYLGCLRHRSLSFQYLQCLHSAFILEDTYSPERSRPDSSSMHMYKQLHDAGKKYNQASWFHFQFNDHNLKSAYKTAYQFRFSPVLIFLVSIQFPLHMFCLLYPYFMYFDAIVNAIVFLISDCLLLLYRNTLHYYILVLYPVCLLKIFIRFSSFL